jgi:hypothetical protein
VIGYCFQRGPNSTQTGLMEISPWGVIYSVRIQRTHRIAMQSQTETLIFHIENYSAVGLLACLESNDLFAHDIMYDLGMFIVVWICYQVSLC